MPEQAEILAGLAEQRRAIEQDLGGHEALSTLARDLINRYLELTVIADHLGSRLVREGCLTPKGAQRAALTAYLGVVDRIHRLAMALGLERRARRVHPLDAIRDAVIEAEEQGPLPRPRANAEVIDVASSEPKREADK